MSCLFSSRFKTVVGKNLIFKNIFFKNYVSHTSTCLEELKYKKKINLTLGESPNVSLLDTTLSIPFPFHLDNERSMRQVYFTHPN